MKALWQIGRERLELRDVPTPAPGAGEVLIRVTASALCGSELGAYRNDRQGNNGGHEAAGVVVELGGTCTRLRVGDRVGVCAVQGCGECGYCRQGRYTYCERRSVVSGMHAEYVASRESACHRLPDDVPWDVGVLLTGDGLGVPYHVAQRLKARAAQGTPVAVFGVGPVGLGNVLVQSHLGAQVVALDVSAYRLDLARRLGATWTVAAPPGAEPEALAAAVREACGSAPEVCLECAGRPATLLGALAAVATGGTVVCIGEQGPAPVSPSDHLIRRDVTLMGSWFYHYSEFPAMLGLYRDGLAVGELMTHHLPFAEAPEGFRQFSAGATGKVVVEYGAED